jgi:hypothetical protein
MRPTVTPRAGAANGSLPENLSFDAEPYETGAPPNHDFEEQGYPIGTPPQNHDFSNGFDGWTTTGAVTLEIWEPYGYIDGTYAKLGNGGIGSGTIESSPFTVDPAAQVMSFNRRWMGTGGYNYLYVYVLSGASYTTSTIVHSSSCNCTSDQSETVSFDFSAWRGQSIKLKLTGYRAIGVSNVGVTSIAIPNWTVDTGVVARKSGANAGSDDDYAWLKGGRTTITSSPFPVAADVQSMSLRSKFFVSVSSGYILDIFVVPQGGSPVKVFTRNCYCTTDWERHWFDVTDWAGQTIQIRVSTWSVAAGETGVDDIGVQHVDLPGWSVVEGLVRREDGGPAGEGSADHGAHYASLYSGNTTIVSSAFVLPSSGELLTLQDRFPATSSPGNSLKTYILSGPGFQTETQVGAHLCDCATEWQEMPSNIQAFAGQTVKLKVWRWSASPGPIWIDEVGANLLRYAQGPQGIPDPYDWFISSGDPLNVVATGDNGDYWTVAALLMDPSVGWSDEWSDCTESLPPCMSSQDAAVAYPDQYVPQNAALADGAFYCQTEGCRNHVRIWGIPYVNSTDSIMAASTEHWPGDVINHYVDSFDHGRDDLFWDLWPIQDVRSGWWTQKYPHGCAPQNDGTCARWDGYVAYLEIDLDPRD